MTGVTMRMWMRLLTMPPMMGAASGRITSAPGRTLHMMGNRLATMVTTVITSTQPQPRTVLHRLQQIRAPKFRAALGAFLCHRLLQIYTITTPVWMAVPNSAM